MQREEWFEYITHAVAWRSTCNRAKVGALAVRDGRILATGYNGAPSGLPHCSHSDQEPCSESVHAEVNVIAQAARFGTPLEGADIWCTHAPCYQCAALLINTHIRAVYYSTNYRNDYGVELLRRAGVVCELLS